MNRSSAPTLRWRFVAGLMFVGTAANLVFGSLFIGGALTPVSKYASLLVRLFPPAVGRMEPTLRVQYLPVAFAYIAITSLISAALVAGLWNTKKWAAWVTTILMFGIIAFDGYDIFCLVWWGGKPSDVIISGLLPGFVWAAAYVAILWVNWIGDKLLPIANAIGKLRRESLPLG